jgi:hypothetical protein
MAEQIIRVVQLWQKVKILPRGKKVLYQLPGLEEMQDLAHEPASDDEEMASGDVGLPETQGSDLPSPIAHEE